MPEPGLGSCRTVGCFGCEVGKQREYGGTEKKLELSAGDRKESSVTKGCDIRSDIK